MYRRTILLCGVTSLLAVVAFSAIAQTATKLPRVVMIIGGTEASSGPFVESFLEGMRQAGQVRGRTVQIDLRYAEFAAVRPLINEVVAETPAVLVVGGLSAARYARDATTTVPIVVATSSDLADAGIVQSLARPGGNITGISDLTDEITVKRLELLKTALPNASRVVLLVNPEFPATSKIEARVQAAAPALGLKVSSVSAKDRASLEKALEHLERSRPDALVATDALAVQLAAELITRATALRIPVVHFWPGTAERGALLSYQADVHDNFRRAAGYVDKILKGTRPSDLPIYQSARYELVVNANVARALGLTLSPSFLDRADRVIQ
jgi:putative ABC transport system substrate-binding protein